MKSQHPTLFITYSPRHIILSIAVALNNECKNSVLVIHDSFFGANLIYDVLKQMKNTPFSEIFFYSNSKSDVYSFKIKEKILFKLSKTKYKLNFHSNIVEGYNLNQVITPMVNDVLCQYLVNKRKLTCQYMEDGLFSYIDMPAKHVNKIKLMGRKLKYGLWYKRPGKTGSPNWVSASWFFNPKLAAKHIRNKPVETVSKDYLNASWFNSFVLKIYEAFQVDYSELSKLDYLIILNIISDVESRNPNVTHELERYIESKYHEGKKIGLKQHPRDSRTNEFTNVVVLPKGFPAELIIPALKSGATLIGDYSTVLIDAKNRGDLIVEVVNNNSENKQFEDIFKTLDIPVHKSFESLLNNY
ncbi:hypothetical protein [Galenea microaerophila]